MTCFEKSQKNKNSLKVQHIFTDSSDVLEARGITPKTSISEQYIPGLQSVIGGNKRQGTPPVQSPPPQVVEINTNLPTNI